MVVTNGCVPHRATSLTAPKCVFQKAASFPSKTGKPVFTNGDHPPGGRCADFAEAAASRGLNSGKRVLIGCPPPARGHIRGNPHRFYLLWFVHRTLQVMPRDTHPPSNPSLPRCRRICRICSAPQTSLWWSAACGRGGRIRRGGKVRVYS